MADKVGSTEVSTATTPVKNTDGSTNETLAAGQVRTTSSSSSSSSSNIDVNTDLGDTSTSTSTDSNGGTTGDDKASDVTNKDSNNLTNDTVAGETALDTDARKALSTALNPDVEEIEIGRVEKYDDTYAKNLASEQIEAARQQYNNSIDNSMSTQAAELNQAVSDAQKEYQTQQNQIDLNEQRALDNAALYAQARGDNGGIGQAQYNAVQNTAAQNRAAVSQAQTKLATDTARQISDLRAQGEFDKADKMLELTQTYLSELRSIEEYAADYNLNVDQINTAIAEWETEYNNTLKQYQTSTELSLAQLTGMFSDGTSTLEARETTMANLAGIALTLIQSGVNPTNLSNAQLNALREYYGMSDTAINDYYNQVK